MDAIYIRFLWFKAFLFVVRAFDEGALCTKKKWGFGGEFMKGFFQTEERCSSFLMRVMLGIVFFPHGAQKVLGWFGGYGFQGTLHAFTSMGMPTFLAVMIIAAEFLGSLGLILGFLTRLDAFGIGCNMVGAIWLVHRHNGFFMNWFGKQTGEGYEYHLLVIGICLALFLAGGGKWSVDAAISRCWRE